jgi:hypothetical protein
MCLAEITTRGGLFHVIFFKNLVEGNFVFSDYSLLDDVAKHLPFDQIDKVYLTMGLVTEDGLNLFEIWFMVNIDTFVFEIQGVFLFVQFKVLEKILNPGKQIGRNVSKLAIKADVDGHMVAKRLEVQSVRDCAGTRA